MVNISSQSISCGEVQANVLIIELKNGNGLKVSTNRVREIITSHPYSLFCKDDYWKLPIHLAIEFDHGIEVIRLLVDAYYESLLVVDNEGYTPIARACHKSSNFDIIQYLCEMCPETLLMSISDGRLPIHISCQMDHTTDSVLYLASKCNESLRRRDLSGYLLIHYACVYTNKASIIPMIVDKYPECLMEMTIEGRLPIHIACSINHPNNDAILFLASRCPESLIIRDQKGFLPIHYTCIYYSKASIIPALVDMQPDGLMIKISDGGLPIHIACRNSMSSDIILYLATRSPESLSTIGYDDLPLHSVLRNYSQTIQDRIVRVLISLRPESVHIRGTKLGRANALDIARHLNNSKGLIYRLLLNSSPDLIKDQVHQSNYRDLNWASREPTFQSIIKLSVDTNLYNTNPFRKVLCSIAKEFYGIKHSYTLCNNKGYTFQSENCGGIGYVILSTILSYV